MANKELTALTLETLEALKTVGGVATLAELKAVNANVASANLTSLVKAGKVVAEDVEVEYVATKTVKKYTVVAE
jgi:ribosomal protein S8E